jgi:hypothetical protein
MTAMTDALLSVVVGGAVVIALLVNVPFVAGWLRRRWGAR